MMESYVRCRARDRKQQISDNFILSKALTLNLSTLFNEKAELCNPWDFYPQTFKEDKENYEHQKLEAELADYRDKRRRSDDDILISCDSFRLYQKYIEPLLPYADDYYKYNIKPKSKKGQKAA